MARSGDGEKDMMPKGQADIWRYMFGFADSMAVKCAAELGIADAIDKHGTPLSLSQIATSIGVPDANINSLSRLMAFLVRRGIFCQIPDPDGGENGTTLYGLTDSSKCLLSDSDLSHLSILLLECHPFLVNPWHSLSRCIKEGGTAFEKEHGSELYDFLLAKPGLNNLFNDGMSCASKMLMKALMPDYKGVFEKVRSIVDVGGGIGTTVSEIVTKYPLIKGINLDLPHVVATAPLYPGVSHVGGDMFVSIPEADAILLKWVLHNWNDEDCIKILLNCGKAIPRTTGKVIIIDIVLQPDGNSTFDDVVFIFDLLMMVNTRGKQRTEQVWKTILEKGGFPRYKIHKIPSPASIIEAYPE